MLHLRLRRLRCFLSGLTVSMRLGRFTFAAKTVARENCFISIAGECYPRSFRPPLAARGAGGYRRWLSTCAARVTLCHEELDQQPGGGEGGSSGDQCLQRHASGTTARPPDRRVHVWADPSQLLDVGRRLEP